MVSEIQIPAYKCDTCGKQYPNRQDAEGHVNMLQSVTKSFAYELGDILYERHVSTSPGFYPYDEFFEESEGREPGYGYQKVIVTGRYVNQRHENMYILQRPNGKPYVLQVPQSQWWEDSLFRELPKTAVAI